MITIRKTASQDHYPFTRKKIAADRAARLGGVARLTASGLVPCAIGAAFGDLVAGIACGCLLAAIVYVVVQPR